jgi:hypothetical protein
MTTSTDKKVTRVTTGFYPSRVAVTGGGYGKPRRIVVTILPGDTLMFRWHGTQQREYVAIQNVMSWATRTRALSERAQKLNAKRRAKT